MDLHILGIGRTIDETIAAEEEEEHGMLCVFCTCVIQVLCGHSMARRRPPHYEAEESACRHLSPHQGNAAM